MKIYEFKWDKTSTDWFLAPNKKEAIEFYINFMSCVQYGYVRFFNEN